MVEELWPGEGESLADLLGVCKTSTPRDLCVASRSGHWKESSATHGSQMQKWTARYFSSSSITVNILPLSTPRSASVR